MLSCRELRWIQRIALTGDVVGYDFVGTVDRVGPQGNRELIGTLRAGRLEEIQGARSNGAFAEYVKVANEESTMGIPPNISPTLAAGLPTPLFAAAQALYNRLGLPRLDQDLIGVQGRWLLIWNAGSAVGQYAIQLARLAGMRVAATCSPSKFKLLSLLGAEVVLDRTDPSVPQQLRLASISTITYGIDCYAHEGSTELCQAAFGPLGGVLVLTRMLLPASIRKDVRMRPLYDLTDTRQPSTSQEEAVNLAQCYRIFERYLSIGKLRPVQVLDLGGLDKVQDGMEMLMSESRQPIRRITTYILLDRSYPCKLVHTISE